MRQGSHTFLAWFFHVFVKCTAAYVFSVAIGDGDKTVHGRIEIMTLREIIERCSMLRVQERRHQDETYGELVFYKEEINEWHRILSEVLGPAVKPAGIRPTKDLVDLTKEYGGIRTGQTLFVREFDDVTVMAMFWPWEDGLHATLKITLLEKRKEEVGILPKEAGLGFSALRMALGKVLFHKPSEKPV